MQLFSELFGNYLYDIWLQFSWHLNWFRMWVSSTPRGNFGHFGSELRYLYYFVHLKKMF